MNGDYERGDCHGQKGLTARPRGDAAEWTSLADRRSFSGDSRCYPVIVRRCKRYRLSFCKKDVSPERGPLRNGNGIYRKPSVIYDRKFLISREGDLKTYMFSEVKKEKVYNTH